LLQIDSIGRSHFGDWQKTCQATLLVAEKSPAAATRHSEQDQKLQIDRLAAIATSYGRQKRKRRRRQARVAITSVE